MDMIAASYVKQNFGDALDERRAARAAQDQVELRRLLAHQHLGIDLLCMAPPQQRKRLEAARGEVARWEDESLCCADYIERWRMWLSLPAKELVQRMCSDADGWGRAMRQNSPFSAAFVQNAKPPRKARP